MALNVTGLINATSLSAATKLKILNNFCTYYGYAATLPDGSANPMTKAEFFNRTLTNHIKTVVKQVEGDAAVITTRQTAEAQVESEIGEL